MPKQQQQPKNAASKQQQQQQQSHRPKPKASAASSKAGNGLSQLTIVAAGVALTGCAVALFFVVGGGGGGGLQRSPCGRYKRVAGCTPPADRCGKLIHDDFATADEVEGLRAIAARGMRLGGGAGGPTILDVHGGALSYKDKFIDVWTAFNATDTPPYRRSEVAIYATLVERVRRLTEATYGVEGLHLTSPTFFSRMSADKPPITQHDEYWHVHVDARQYGSFVYTAVLYLADAGKDFEGGTFEFMGSDDDPPRGPAAAAVPPTKGRLVLFTSGDEHPHRVTAVTKGTRVALTIAFTCDRQAAIDDFLGRALED